MSTPFLRAFARANDPDLDPSNDPVHAAALRLRESDGWEQSFKALLDHKNVNISVRAALYLLGSSESKAAEKVLRKANKMADPPMSVAGDLICYDLWKLGDYDPWNP